MMTQLGPMMKNKGASQSFVVFLLLFGSWSLPAQSVKRIETDIFTVVYCEPYQQPLKVWYKVQCPMGDESRSGMDFYKVDGVITSDNDDYKDNVWDKGHIAPAADFNCDRETLKKTFSYLNCALQHEGLNRGPWKELERFERDLAKVYFPSSVHVQVEILFEEEEEWLPTGALVPSGFKKTIKTPENEWTFVFPNRDVAGQDWINFRTN